MAAPKCLSRSAQRAGASSRHPPPRAAARAALGRRHRRIRPSRQRRRDGLAQPACRRVRRPGVRRQLEARDARRREAGAPRRGPCRGPDLIRLLGPNCLCMLSPRIDLDAIFAHIDALPGEIAFLSQSGALVAAVLDWAQSRRIGFSHRVSLGERADVDSAHDTGDRLALRGAAGHPRRRRPVPQPRRRAAK